MSTIKTVCDEVIAEEAKFVEEGSSSFDFPVRARQMAQALLILHEYMECIEAGRFLDADNIARKALALAEKEFEKCVTEENFKR